MAKRYLKNTAVAIANPPQSEPLNERQVKNSAGGYAYPVDMWKRLDRFLILGSEGGSYYASEKKLTLENGKSIAACLKEDGVRVVKRIVEISDSGRAPKNDPALMALALAAGTGDNYTRSAALEALPKVARIGTHLFHFVDYVTEFRGWGRGLRMAVRNWYLDVMPEKLADQVTKYQQRDGWSHKNLLALSHANRVSEGRKPIEGQDGRVTFEYGVVKNQFNAIARWVTKGEVSENLPERILGHIELQKATDGKTAAALIRKYGLVRESVPTELLKDRAVWEALLEKMPMTALIRNLGNLSKCELLVPMSEASKKVVEQFGNEEQLRKERVHPIQVLIALKTYQSGHGVRGSGEWKPVPAVIDALDGAFYTAFKLVEPTGKRFYLGLDISGSMWNGVVAGVEGLTPAVASGAMAMTTVKTEQEYYAAGFTAGGRNKMDWRDGTEMSPLALSPKLRLDDVVEKMEKMSEKMGRTDCALPMLDAIEKKMKVDVFVIITDSETWAGDVHVDTAIQRYRDKMGIPAKVAVIGMVANNFTIADPNDAGMMDFVGFDTAVPQLLSDFAKD
jgi:60 kDa SS-A/Ro ribonucleoprotein